MFDQLRRFVRLSPEEPESVSIMCQRGVSTSSPPIGAGFSLSIEALAAQLFSLDSIHRQCAAAVTSRHARANQDPRGSTRSLASMIRPYSPKCLVSASYGNKFFGGVVENKV